MRPARIILKKIITRDLNIVLWDQPASHLKKIANVQHMSIYCEKSISSSRNSCHSLHLSVILQRLFPHIHIQWLD